MSKKKHDNTKWSHSFVKDKETKQRKVMISDFYCCKFWCKTHLCLGFISCFTLIAHSFQYLEDYVVLGIEPRSAIWKISTSPLVLSLWRQCTLFRVMINPGNHFVEKLITKQLGTQVGGREENKLKKKGHKDSCKGLRHFHGGKNTITFYIKPITVNLLNP